MELDDTITLARAEVLRYKVQRQVGNANAIVNDWMWLNGAMFSEQYHKASMDHQNKMWRINRIKNVQNYLNEFCLVDGKQRTREFLRKRLEELREEPPVINIFESAFEYEQRRLHACEEHFNRFLFEMFCDQWDKFTPLHLPSVTVICNVQNEKEPAVLTFDDGFGYIVYVTISHDEKLHLHYSIVVENSNKTNTTY